MTAFLLAHETTIRLTAFGLVLIGMACWELASPRRKPTQSKAVRWANNLTLVAVNTLLLRFLFPVAAVGVALNMDRENVGLFNWLKLPEPLAILFAVIILDFVIWAQHVIFHKVPILWRLHRMHHADLDYDVTTGARFHPIEIILSMGIKMAVVALIGAPAAAVILFEVLLNATALFNHANIKLPQPVDRALRYLIVTPDMHRVHHSWHWEETDSNYGFNLSVWDRLFGTYRVEARDGQEGMTIGLESFRDPSNLRLDKLITLPFRSS
ncbi:MAG: sterol desaturase family protein [Magnetovibrionaceae bacterium]